MFDVDSLGTLKRAQLQKLCKKHDIKANGKNSELIEKLTEFAKSLPEDNNEKEYSPDTVDKSDPQNVSEEKAEALDADPNENTDDPREPNNVEDEAEKEIATNTKADKTAPDLDNKEATNKSKIENTAEQAILKTGSDEMDVDEDIETPNTSAEVPETKEEESGKQQEAEDCQIKQSNVGDRQITPAENEANGSPVINEKTSGEKTTQNVMTPVKRESPKRLYINSLQAVSTATPIPKNIADFKTVSNAQFKDFATNIMAELESRTSTMTEDEKKAASKEWRKAHGIPEDGSSSKSDREGKDRYSLAHKKMFDNSDSIANHWAASRKTPRQPDHVIFTETPGKRRLVSHVKETDSGDSSETPSKRQRTGSVLRGPSTSGNSSLKSPIPHFMTPRRAGSVVGTSVSRNANSTLRSRKLGNAGTPSSVRRINHKKKMLMRRNSGSKAGLSDTSKSPQKGIATGNYARPLLSPTKVSSGVSNVRPPSRAQHAQKAASSNKESSSSSSLPSYMRSTAACKSRKSAIVPKAMSSSTASGSSANLAKKFDLEASLKKQLPYKPHTGPLPTLSRKSSVSSLARK
ncbi:hypothetical protein H4219_002262 [Mycoemilia scoparia]|uniref:SAP domain-containing protein n=1 Tax=Mycoemilia scoparia TaxID=417184 RepID=A0A9W8DUA9_9FUNG|nr:hypothetical protein H4219_002262 [Mycoemilia scoparia]